MAISSLIPSFNFTGLFLIDKTELSYIKVMIKYLRWNTANKRLKDLIANTNFDEVYINNKAGNYTFLIDMPAGEHIELWLNPSDIDVVWYCNSNERACINPRRHLVAKEFVHKLYFSIRMRKHISEIERDFFTTVRGCFSY